MSEDNTVRDIKSLRPFFGTVREYERRGWTAPMPMPAREKHPPPSGFTGRTAKDVTSEQIDEWRDDKAHAKANIALKMNEVRVFGKKRILVGIDVDDYTDGQDAEGADKLKLGYAQLEALEAEYGPLPDTWTSSSRSDGRSGIRFFLAPIGLEWRGKADKDIDVIQPGHRYAMIYPSWHPKGGQYLWYEPGQIPDGTRPTVTPYIVSSNPVPGGFQSVFSEDPNYLHIPKVEWLPELPEKWVTFLTQGRMPASKVRLDMDSSVDQIMTWGKDRMRKGKRCKQTNKSLLYWKEQILKDASSHDKVLAGHWQMVRMGVMEGHVGCYGALSSLNKVWTMDVVKRGKRTPSEAGAEMFRSISLALRKMKAEIDDAHEQGIVYQPRSCACYDPDDDGPSDGPGDGDGPSPSGEAKDPGDYALTDDGNGDHLVDLYGDELKYVLGYEAWIYWNGARWNLDAGDGLARRCYRRVRDRQTKYARHLMNVAIDAADGGDEAQAKRAKATALRWQQHAERSGSNHGADNALKAGRFNEDVTIKADLLDRNETLLGVNNGVLELTKDGFSFRQAKHDDYVVYNTGVDYLPMDEQFKRGGESRTGVELWNGYLDRFIPDKDLRKFVQKSLGYCLLGRNTERLAIFLYGGTSTGKTTMLDAVMAALGEYAGSIRLKMLMGGKDLNPELVAALPRRVVTISETGESGALEADVFKRVTGGDRLSAENKGSNIIIERVPAFTPVIATNLPPTIHGADKALQKRLLILPFNQSVADADDDKMAASELSRLGSGAVLAWLVDGWAMYAKEGLPRQEWPDVVEEATVDFGSKLSDLNEFIDDCVTVTKKPFKEDFVSSAEMHDAYLEWCAEQRVQEKEILARNAFSRRLAPVLGIDPKQVRLENTVVRGFAGVKLIERRGSGITIVKR